MHAVPDGHPRLFLYDTTLRDGAQRRGLNFSLSDKLRITQLLDAFGVDYIEGGWPGSNPKDEDYFAQVRDLPLKHARIAAFGSTRRVGKHVGDDTQLRSLIAAQTPVVTMVGKSWALHVTDVLRTTLEENLNLIRDSIAFIKDAGREVIFDAEHFFDGFRADPDYALACLNAAAEAGADSVVLCDTNGGSLPQWIAQVTTRVVRNVKVNVGVHTHNDAELAVANALAAVQAGARQIQGTINGYGERCGNANLVSLLPTLVYKLNYQAQAAAHLRELTRLSRQIAELANVTPDAFAPYVGSNAFTHKGGIHASAVARLASSYEHLPPELIGNHNDIVVSELAGWSNVLARAQTLGIQLHEHDKTLLQEIKQKEARGVHLEAAEGSFELLLRRREQAFEPAFVLEDFRVESRRHQQQEMACQATCKLRIGHETLLTAAEAQGPVAAIDAALRKALVPYWPELHDVKLSDYTVRILDAENATAATTRVIIEAVWREQTWRTVGASENIIDASAQALVESFELFILKRRGQHYGDTAA